MMRRFVCILMILVPAMLFGAAPSDRREVRAGNRKFGRENYRAAEIDYRKAALKDSLSVAAQYNLASTLYRENDMEGAGKALDAVKGVAPASSDASRYYFNAGDVALQKEDYGAAVEAFRQSLLKNPDDLEAKENYIYAKKMLKNRQDQQNQTNQDQNNNDKDQDKGQDQNQNNDNKQDNNQDKNRDGNDNQDSRNRQGDGSPQISEQQARQMLNAIQAREKETQDKVKKEKAELLKSRQKEKNW
ncbi:MAG: tetratricopeptide repeat protein [Bacteroidales bacterium]|nr:tetratricopeptide repeat protein [Bacteroidales bacterium]